MKQGKHSVGTSRNNSVKKRSLMTLIALILLVAVAVGGTLAYLTANTSEVTNTFTAAGAPTPSITEEFDKTEKKNVKVALSTEGTGAYYVRAAVVYSFQDEAGNTVAKIPAAGTDYTITMGTGWSQGSDGYYYYNGTVTPGGSTTNLIDSCVTLNTEYKLVVDIVAQTIQAVPSDAATNEWGYTPTAA